VRVDSGVYAGWTVPVEYDPLLAKLIVWAGTRDEAVRRCARALREYYVTGIRTNICFFRDLLCDPEFVAGRLHTGFLEDYFDRRPAPPPDLELIAVVALVAAVHDSRRKEIVRLQPAPASPWRSEGRERLQR
jgi:acetyl-CoA carboxylase biotin carboxylase subunit